MLEWLSPDDSLFEDKFNLASWYAVCISVGCWTSMYYAVRYTFDSKSAEWCNRLVTLFHGLATSIRGLQQCYEDNGDWAFEGTDLDSSRHQMIILVVSLGYFIFDLGWCLAYETETNLMIFHHIYSCIALYRVLVSEISGAQASCGLGTMEVTNPLLQCRWFLRTEGYYHTYWFTAVEVSFIILFFIVRIVFGSYFFYMIVISHSNDWEFRLLTLVIYVLSWVFWVNICKFIYLKYIEKNIRTYNSNIN